MEMDETSELKVRFTYHRPVGDQPKKYEEIRDFGHEFAALIYDFAVDCRERSLAITKIEEAVMWANAAIARRNPREVED